MLGEGLVTRKQSAGSRLQHGRFVILAGERLDRVERLEASQRHKCDLTVRLSPQYLRAKEASDAAHRWKEFG